MQTINQQNTAKLTKFIQEFLGEVVGVKTNDDCTKIVFYELTKNSEHSSEQEILSCLYSHGAVELYRPNLRFFTYFSCSTVYASEHATLWQVAVAICYLFCFRELLSCKGAEFTLRFPGSPELKPEFNISFNPFDQQSQNAYARSLELSKHLSDKKILLSYRWKIDRMLLKNYDSRSSVNVVP